MENKIFRKARQADGGQILALYRDARLGPFCTWDEYYPGMTEIEQDLATGNLYVLTDGGRILGAISVVPENEMDGFACWSRKDGREIARVVVDRACRGQGLALRMVRSVEAILGQNGCPLIRLAVVKSNIPARRTYIKAGFSTVGEADMYGHSFYLMEKEPDGACLPE